MIAYGNRYKRNLGVTLAEFIEVREYFYNSQPAARVRLMSEYAADGTAKEWTYYSAGGGLMRLYATAKMAQSRNPKGEVFAVEVPE